MQEEALKGYRLSPQQRHLWMLLRHGWNEPYHTKCAVSVNGRLESRRLKIAAQNIIARHEILRTTLQCLPGMTIPMQVIEETGGICWQEDDLSGTDDRVSLIEAFFHAAPPPFDLDQGPLLRFHLIKRAKSDYVLIICLPAICADSASLRNLVGELSRGYAAARRGEELDGDVAQYADLAEWQNELIESEETRAGREYWRNRTLPRRPTPQLAFEGGPVIDAAFEPRLDELAVSPSLTARIESFARSKETPLGQFLLACWQILLWRYTGQSEVEVGTVFDGRRAAEIEGALGLFAKYLPVTCHLEEGLQFSQLLQQIAQSFLTVRDRQEYFSWEQIAGSPANAPAASYFPFCFEPEASPADFSAGDISFTLFKEYACIDRFKIKLSSARRADGLVIEFHYNSELFRPADIQSLIGHFHTLLENVIAYPLAKVGELEMLTNAERRQLLVEYNSTKIEWPREKFVHELISEQVNRAPEAIAVICEEEWVTYHELNDRAGRLANHLHGLGVGPEVVVGIFMERSPDLIVGLLAILKAGGAYLPLDASYPPARLSFMLEDAGVKTLLTQTHLRSRLLRVEQMQVIDVDALWDFISQTPARECETLLSPDNLAYVIYTSGSTGRPKGVMLRHKSLTNYLLWAIGHYTPGAGCGAPVHSSLSFDLTITSLFTPLLAGGYLHLLSTESEIEALGAALSERPGYGLVKLTPGRLQLLAELLKDDDLDGAARSLVIGGENLPAQTVGWWRERAVTTRLFNEYGPTESVVGCCVYEVGSQVEVEEGRAVVPIGRPIANTSLYIFDKRQRPSPKGVVGELCIGGEGLARGYLNHPELTAESFVPAPYSEETGTRLYRTGDLARYLRDGQIECLGRMDEQVKIRGYRVELGEIEARLADHPAVHEAVVAARENNSGDKQLVAFYTLAKATDTDAPVGAEALREHLSAVLPEHMIPAAYVALEKLPLTPNGKLDRRALPSPDRQSYATREYEAPVGEIETALARIWADLLQVEEVGRHDNFFALGGHSLLTVTLIERMRREGLHGDVRELFTNPTVAALAATVGGDDGLVAVPRNLIPVACSAITPEMLPLVKLSAAEIERIVSAVPGGAANVQDIYPLAPLQEGILFHHLMMTEGDVYLSPSLLSFDSRARLERFLRALQGVIDRHDILRTAVLWEGLPEPVQVVWRQAPLITEEVSLDTEKGAIAEQLLARFNPRSYRIDVRQAPLMRVYIAPAGLNGDERECRWVMLHLFHHLSVDHTTFEVLLQEVQAHLLGRVERLPAPLPFRNFVAQARLGVSQQEHEAFFRKMLGDVDEPTAPYGLINVQGDGSGVKEARREVEAELASRLRQIARALGVSPASLYHLAWARVLGRVSGRDDVVFGTVLLGRMQGGEGADRAPGMFINTLPVRIRIGEESVRDGIRRTHTLLARLLRHEHAPLALAQRCSGVAAPAPLFSSFLNYRHSKAADAVAADAWDALPAWEGIEILGGEERTNYPISLSVDDLGEGFALNAQVESPVDPDRICAYLHTAVEELVESLERAPATPVRSLEVLPASERRQLLVEWNATTTEYPHEQCIHTLFEAQAAGAPHAVAVVDGGCHLSYGELNDCANRLAHYLRALGAQPGVRVVILLERSIELALAELAVLKCGAAYVPLDRNAPAERQSFMIQDCGAGLALTVKDLELPESAGVKRVDLDAWMPEGRPARNPAILLESEAPAYVIYTSGSTGRPKGVVVPHRAIGRLALNNRYAVFEAGDRVAFTSNPAFDASTMEVWAPLLHGGCVVVVPEEVLLDPNTLADLLRREEVSILHLVAGLLGAYAELLAPIFPSLRYLMTGGDLVDPRAVAKILRDSPPQHLIHCYGPSESTTFATTHEVIEVPEGARSIPIGRPIGNTQIYILDRALQVVPVGVEGELYIGGKGVVYGYLNQEELTAEKFLPDVMSAELGARIYRTGDVARYLADGKIEFLGRIDHQVKIRGFRIELGEIEAQLGVHPAVRQCVAVAYENEKGEKRLGAYMVCEDENAPGANELRSYLKERLPEYMLPAWFARLEQMPLTPNGKIDRQALAAAEVNGREESAGYVAARTPVEEIVVGIFEEVLGLDRIGREDNFFEIGGHSLLATQVVSRVRGVFGVGIGVRSVFEEATAEGLARRIEETMRTGEKEKAPPLVRGERGGQRGKGLPLSFAQQRLWFIDQLETGNVVYNMPGAVRLEGRLDLHALERAINEIVTRHEALRTRFEVEEGAPVQVIEEAGEVSLPLMDLSESGEEQAELKARSLAAEEAQTPFDLSWGPLLRVRLLKLGDERHLMLFTMHHIISDGWSIGILVREVSKLYEAYSRGEGTPLKELEIQYADYAVWQRGWLQGEVLEEELEYWKNQLGGELPVLELPADKPRPAVQTYRGAVEKTWIGEELTGEVKRLSRQENATLFMALLAAFKVLLVKYSGQEDVVVGTPIAGRNRVETEAVIGFFVNTLALRTKVVVEQGFRQMIGRVREVALGAYTHQDVPFEKLVEELKPERSLSRSPLFQVMFNLVNFRDEKVDIKMPGLQIEGVTTTETPGSKFDLTLYSVEKDGLIKFDLVYNADIYNKVQMVEMLGHLRNLIGELVSNPGIPLSAISLLTMAERHQIRTSRNAIKITKPFAAFQKQDIEQSIADRFEEQAGNYPENIAVKTESHELTYRELNSWANLAAITLLQTCVPGEDKVAILFEHDAPMLVGMLGALKAGKAYVPLDLSHPVQRLAHILNDSRAGVILTNDRNSALAGDLAKDGIRVISIDSISKGEQVSDIRGERSPDKPAYILYTSGSTGRPKGVLQNNRNVLHFIRAYANALHINSADKLTLLSTYNFDAAVMDVYGALLNGATLYPYDIKTRGLADLSQLLIERGISIYHSTPTVYKHFVESLTEEEQFPDLRLVALGGEAVYKTEVELYKKRFSPECVLINLFGATESSLTLHYLINKQVETARNSVPIGYPVEDTDVFLLNSAGRQEAAYGTGEIIIRSSYAALGYWQQPELTSNAFLPDTEDISNKSLYRTGDIGRLLPDGSIEFVERKDFQVKIRGYRIELGEIEAALAEHSSVQKAVVTVPEDKPGRLLLVAYLLVNQDEEPRIDEIKAYLRERLPDYMLPSAYMTLERMPLTPNGKVDRRSLPVPEVNGSVERSGHITPRTEVEEILAGIFEEVLKLDRVGIYDNFFEIGGHSLLAAQVILRARSKFGVEIGVRSIFEEPAVEGLARRIEEAIKAGEKEEAPPLIKASRERQSGARFPLSFAQQRLWFLDRLAPKNPIYNIPGAVMLEGRLDIDALERSVNEIFRRHEALRTRIEVAVGEPAQVIDEWQPRRLEIKDLTGLIPEEREEETRRIAGEEAEIGFDLTKGPLLRVKLLKLKEEEHLLLYTIHHIASDGWSMGILIREVGTLYLAYSRGEESPLEELDIQYADFAVWQRSWLQGEALEKHLGYWRRQLAGVLPVLELPTDRPRAAMQTYHGARQFHLLPITLSDSLKALSLEQGGTLFMTLLAAFNTLLYYLTGQTEICVGTDIANRNRAETEKLIGFFVNQLALRTELSPNSTFNKLLRKVKEITLEAYAHQDLPFEKLVEALNPDRDASRTPLFQVKMALQNVPVETLSLSGLTLRPVGAIIETAKFDLLFNLLDTEQGLSMSLQYNTDLFEGITATRMLNRFHTLLDRIVERPDTKLQDLVESLIEEDKREQIEKKSELKSLSLRKLKLIKRRAIVETMVETEK